MKFDASVLSDHELVVLESALRVQLTVAKHVRAQQLTGAIGGAILTGGISALLSGPSIICSAVLRKKCQRRHQVCCRELFLRKVSVAPVQEVTYAKRALALSIASGLTCCVLGFALDIMVDEAVLQVLAFFFSMVIEGRFTQGTTNFVHDRAADLVGRQDVFVLNESAMLFGASAQSQEAEEDRHEQTALKKKRSLIGKFIEKPKQLWKAASWSFSSTEMQMGLRGVTQRYRQTRSMRDKSSSNSYGDDDDGGSSFEEWAMLFSNEYAHHGGPSTDKMDDLASNGPETLFGCRFRAVESGEKHGERSREQKIEEEEVDLVRSDAFSLFGECYVVRVRTVTTIADESPQSAFKSHVQDEEDVYHPTRAATASSLARETHDVTHVVPWGSHMQESFFTGDAESWAFWDGIWGLEEERPSLVAANSDEEEGVEYGIGAWSYEEEVEYGIEVWSGEDQAGSAASVADPRENDLDDHCDAFSLFGVHDNGLRAVTTSNRRRGRAKDGDDTDAYTALFG